VEYPQEIWVKARVCRDRGMRLGVQRLHPLASALKGVADFGAQGAPYIYKDNGRGRPPHRFFPDPWYLTAHRFNKAAAPTSNCYSPLLRLFQEDTMKARIWLILTIGMLMAGCAPGYYEKPVAPETPTETWTRNPETQEEYERRIRREEWESRFPRGRWGR
jgi:hypothetical protein